MSKSEELKVEVKRGRLVISIGIETLAQAFEESEYAKPYDRKQGDWVPRLYVTNHAEFAKEVCMALNAEEENGSTLVHVLLDAACVKALDDGALGVEEVEDADE